MIAECQEDGVASKRFRWRTWLKCQRPQGACKHVVHARGHVLRRVRCHRLHRDFSHRRETQQQRGRCRKPSLGTSTAVTRTTWLRGNQCECLTYRYNLVFIFYYQYYHGLFTDCIIDIYAHVKYTECCSLGEIEAEMIDNFWISYECSSLSS